MITRIPAARDSNQPDRPIKEGGSGWETIKWRQRLYEDMCIEIARANYAMLKERTLPPRVA